MDRVKAMCELDIDTARAMLPDNFTDSEILAGLHKARIHMADIFDEITEAMVIESREFLTEIGMNW